MARKTITISVPEAVHRFIENRVDEAGFGSVSEYFRTLVREDRQKLINRMNRATSYERHTEPQRGPVYRPLASAARRQK